MTPVADDQVGIAVLTSRRCGFDELIGQDHVARALSNAIAANRVGHAYLFTGARGVGKTSAARILAKALDCQFGPTATPCNECDICQSISAGSDVDVAVLWADGSPSTLAGSGIALAGELEASLGLPVDVVSMNAAPVDLVRRVLRDGTLVLEHDASARVRFEVDARNRWFDMEPILRDYREAAGRHHGRP